MTINLLDTDIKMCGIYYNWRDLHATKCDVLNVDWPMYSAFCLINVLLPKRTLTTPRINVVNVRLDRMLIGQKRLLNFW